MHQASTLNLKLCPILDRIYCLYWIGRSAYLEINWKVFLSLYNMSNVHKLNYSNFLSLEKSHALCLGQNCNIFFLKPFSSALVLYEQGQKRHKPWPIQKVIKYQDNCTLSRQFNTVMTVPDCQDSSKLTRQLQIDKTVADCKECCRL